MKKTLENKQKAISYLLAELSDAERDAMEEQLFVDEEFSLFVNAVENDLIDEYIRGELDRHEKLKFENAYLRNETRREKVSAAQVLQKSLFTKKQEKQIFINEPKVSFWESLTNFFRFPNFALASGLAAILLVLLGTIWLVTRNSIDENSARIIENKNQPDISPPPIPAPPANLPVNNQLNTNNSLENNSEVNKTPSNLKTANSNSNKSGIEPKKPETEKTPQKQAEVPHSPRIFAFTLLPPTRSSERPVLKISSDTEQVRLRILNSIEELYVKYTVEITDENGERIWKQNFSSDGKIPKKFILLNLPNELLKSGAYEVTLLGTTAESDVEEINFYNFSVNKK